MPRTLSKNARVRRRANVRFRNFLFASSIICISAIGLFAYLALRPQTLRIAVSQADTADVKVIDKISRLFAARQVRIRIVPVVTDSTSQVIELLRQAKADLGIARGEANLGSEVQSVAVFRKNFVVLWTLNGPTSQKVRRARKLQDLDGHALVITGQAAADQDLARLILSESGVAPSKVQFTSETSSVERDRSSAVFMATAPLKSKALVTAIEKTVKERGEPIFLGIDAADAIAQKQPIFEADELPPAVFKPSPAWPPEKIDTLTVNDLILARESLPEETVATFTRRLFAIRNTLIDDFPGLVEIQKPNTDKDAAIPAHRGAAAFIDGTERTFLEQYSDFIWAAVLLLSALGSTGAWLRAYIKRDERENNAALRARLLKMTKQARLSKSVDELEQMRLDVDDIIADTLHCYEDGAIAVGELSVFNMMLAQFQQAASDRRLELLLDLKS